MIDPVHITRMTRALDVLAGEHMTFARLRPRGVSWRALMDLQDEGAVTYAGSTERAQVIYKRTEER